MPSTIKAFIGTHYNLNRIKNLSSVVCPPYDVIDKRQLCLLKKKSPYNFSRILLATNNNYKKIGDRFRKWTKEKILVKNKKRSLYFYEQEFFYEGKKYKRFGILGLLGMNKKGVIFPHEYTLKEPKKDRSRIIREFKTNLSPIFVIVPKRLGALKQIYQSYCLRRPFVRFLDCEGNRNRVWKIEDREDIKKICQKIDKYKLVIADGHHRFEVACSYYRKNKNKFKDLNYILAYFTDVQEGLLVLPTHRIAKVKNKDLFKTLKAYFYIKRVSKDSLRNGLKKKKGVFSLGIYRNNKFYFLRLKNSSILDKIIYPERYDSLRKERVIRRTIWEEYKAPSLPDRQAGKFSNGVYRPVYKNLDTYLLQRVVFPLVGVEEKISYTHNLEEARQMAGKDKVAFILRSTPLKIVFDIAERGFRLPQKSTYFYPKVPCGIVIREFEK